MLRIEGVVTSYGHIEAVRGVDLAVPPGGVVALIGPNGAGKSTLLNTVSGLLRPRSGRIIFEGRDITGWPAARIARSGLLQVPEGRQVLGPLSVEENLLLGGLAATGRAAPPKLEEIFALFPVLAERRRQTAGSLSGGQQQMLAIGRALMGRPRLLVLDEPSLGLAPIIVSHVFQVLRRLNADGLTILLVEQNARLALAIGDVAYVLEQGRIVRFGAGAELAADPDIIEHYLPRFADDVRRRAPTGKETT
ncbi:ABC transporter ATP-binding protein [Blastochloris viridis]|uniref:Branched-chain amino acid transport ATP-binding protein LivF n=1 Tax=Blastochloris viridis TaxID=1079 RepID=A0A0H5BQ39_BLAVI|nr:ABC transporter ATP-binding protein [Blastochloris viridis]ALK09800.1 High-affinity branched-chain amino acid transport ATP-binding protein LivF [Blastochloris viridis]BAS00299.1 branched-chain amino acid transport ATP-binding protein LivF [Blastochloris viridis]CUU42463.1 LIV-I protein F [Blastochloris viridis]